MAQFPAFPLWTDAYLADTHHLTTIEHGAYLLLLVAMWRNKGTLPNDDRQLAKFAHLNVQQWQRMKPAIMDFFTIAGGELSQGRLTDELSYVREHSKKQANKARNRWAVEQTPPPPVKQPPLGAFNGSGANPLENINVGDAVAMPERCRSDAPTPTPTPTPFKKEAPDGALSEPAVSDHSKPKRSRKEYPADFEAAWLAYPRHSGMSKAEALPQWRKLTPEQRAMVLPSIPGYLAHLKAKPDLETIHFCRYLSKRRFEGFAPQPVTEADWQKRLGFARNSRVWSTREWGPMPGLAGCVVPPEQLIPTDGKDWREYTQAA